MSVPSPPTCTLECTSDLWVPRGEGCFFLANYTGGLFPQPCYIPFGNIPPLFHAMVWGVLLALIILIVQCNRKPKDNPSGSPSKQFSSVVSDSMELASSAVS